MHRKKTDTHTHIADHNLSIPKLVSLYVWDCLVEVSAYCLSDWIFGGILPRGAQYAADFVPRWVNMLRNIYTANPNKQ